MDPGRKKPKIVISGYYGFDNCGDEAVLLAMVHCLKTLAPGVRISVLSGNPEKTRGEYGVDAVSRWSLVKIAKEILSCRLLISGGGSLLQDVTSARSPAYYLGVIRIALFLRKKVMIYAQGVGPLTLPGNRATTAKVFNRIHTITVRDNRSAELLKELGVRKDLTITCDPVMALGYEDKGTVLLSRYSETGEPSPCLQPSPCLLVAVRCWKDDRHIAPIAKLLDAQAAKGWDVLLVPAHFPDDTTAIAKLRDLMATQPRFIDKCLTASEFLELSSKADRVFSMRLHGLICAMAMGTPMIGLSYDPKVDAFMEQAGMKDYCLSFDNFDLETAKRLLEDLDKQPQRFGKEQESRRAQMQKLAWETAELAVALLGTATK